MACFPRVAECDPLYFVRSVVRTDENILTGRSTTGIAWD